MDLAKPKALRALEAVMELGSFTQYRVWKKAGTSFATAHNLIHYLQEKNVVAKIGKKYAITTWPGLLGLFAVYRTFPKPIATLQLAMPAKKADEYFTTNKFIRCLTSAWERYDDYLRDPQLHFYSPGAEATESSLSELSHLPKGTTIVNIYLQDLQVSPVKHGRSLSTSLPRTLLDLYSSNYAYAAENWIRKKAMKWKPE
ncbi:hypothetical protein HZC09_01180 [Candidatus Micrarchaeota archaeon]|nr:hypothetical protein [Candidatus Micrarchaeota archaeon]